MHADKVRAIDESRQRATGAGYGSIKPDLLRLCSALELDSAWVEQSDDCGQLLERVLQDFERLLDQPVRTEDDCRRLRGLIRFSTRVSSLHEKAAAWNSVRQRLEELERENRELRAALTAGGPRPLKGGETCRDERLAETFKTLSTLAHKINNPLTSLIGRTQLMRMSCATDERTTKTMTVIEESARRVADYVRELALVVKDSRERELGE